MVYRNQGAYISISIPIPISIYNGEGMMVKLLACQGGISPEGSLSQIWPETRLTASQLTTQRCGSVYVLVVTQLQSILILVSLPVSSLL